MRVEHVAKTLILNQHGQVLVLKRHPGDSHRPGQWDLPGGQVDAGEKPIHAAIREAREETQLSLRNLAPVHVCSQIYGDTQVVKTVFTTHDYDGILELSWEHTDLMWVPVDEFQLLAISASYKDAVKALQHHLVSTR